MNFQLLEQIYRQALAEVTESDRKKAVRSVTYLVRELEAEDRQRTLRSIWSDRPQAEDVDALRAILRQIRKRMNEIIEEAKQAGTYIGMIEKLKIRSIGFWKGPQEPLLPDPANFVDLNWDPAERELVIRHLNSGNRILFTMGSSWCRLCGKRDNGSKELSDGYYLWPEGLAHYLEAHHVRLPREFIEHCQRYPSTPEKNLFRMERMNANYYIHDKAWWHSF